jgi:hypothetical protein
MKPKTNPIHGNGTTPIKQFETKSFFLQLKVNIPPTWN